MDYKNDMDEFIRETMRSSRRIRDKNFSPIQNTVASSATSSSTFSETQIPLSETMRVRGSISGGDSPIPTPPSSGIYVLGSVDGEIEWFETDICN